MKNLISIVLLFSASVAGAQTLFSADPSYDYSGNEWFDGFDTVANPGYYFIVEPINTFSESSTSITLYVSTGQSFTFNRTSVGFADDILSWQGLCTSGTYPTGVAYLSVQDGVISGTVRLTDTFISVIQYIGDDHYLIYEGGNASGDCDAQLFSNDLDHDPVPPGGRIGFDCVNVVMYRLVLAYTPEYAAYYSNNQTLINNSLIAVIDTINKTYEASNVAIRARLAFAYKTAESESGNFAQDFQNFEVSYYPGVNSNKWDIVSTYQGMVRGDVAGILVSAYADGKAGRSSQNHKRFLYKRGIASSNFGAAHEIGHIFGLEHNIQEFSGFKWFARLALNRKQAYGFRSASKKCVMSYGAQTREHVYSATDLTFSNGETAGDDKAQGRNYMWSHFGNVVAFDDFPTLPLSSFTFTSDMMSHLYAYDLLTTSNVTINSGATVKLESSDVVKFLPGTWIKNGANMSASIKACENTEGARMIVYNEPEEQVRPERPVIKERTYDALKVYPNPASTNFHVSQYFKTPTDVKFILRDVNSNIIMQSSATSVEEFVKTIDTNSLPKGVYFVETTTGVKRQVEKVVVQ